MKDRDDIDADVISLIGEPYEMRMAGLLQIQIFLLADIRDVLTGISDREFIVSLVPPDYGKEDKLI